MYAGVCYADRYVQAGRCYAEVQCMLYDALCNVRCAGTMRYAGRSAYTGVCYGTEYEYNAVYEMVLKARDFDEKWQANG